jgi:RNA polymerase sigma-70 factor (ECF subfamily)
MNPHSDVTPPGAEHFVTTHWSVVLRAGGAESAAAQDALSELCRSYWYPLYGFIRRQGKRRRTPKI